MNLIFTLAWLQMALAGPTNVAVIQSEPNGKTFYVFDENGVGSIVLASKQPKLPKFPTMFVVSESEYKIAQKFNASKMNEAESAKGTGISAKRIAEVGILVGVIDAGLEKGTLVDKRPNASPKPTEAAIREALASAKVRAEKVNLSPIDSATAFWCKVVINSEGGTTQVGSEVMRAIGSLFNFSKIGKVEVLARTKMTAPEGKEQTNGDFLRVTLSRPEYTPALAEDREPIPFLKKLKETRHLWAHPSAGLD